MKDADEEGSLVGGAWVKTDACTGCPLGVLCPFLFVPFVY